MGDTGNQAPKGCCIISEDVIATIAATAAAEVPVSIGSMTVKGQGELEVQETDKQWSIPEFARNNGKGFSMSRTILGREITREQLAQVLATGKSELITGFVSQRTNRAFDAYLVLDAAKGNVSFEFPPRESRSKQSAPKADKKFTAANAAAEDLSTARRHGVIKVKSKGEHELLETENAWHVEGLTYGKNRKPMVIAKVMCGMPLSAETVAKLLTKGKTDLIQGFVSHKTGNKFDAYLVFTPGTGRVSYEFPPRK